MDKKKQLGIVVFLVLAVGIVSFLKTKCPELIVNQIPKWDSWGDNRDGGNEEEKSPIIPDEIISGPEEKPNKPFASPKTYAEALAQAKTNNSKIFLFFHTENCTHCKRMENETFKDSKVKSSLSKFVIYHADANVERELASKYKVYFGVPAYFIISADEKVIKKEIGFKSAKEFNSWLKIPTVIKKRK